MSFIGDNPKVKTVGLVPQSADPTSPSEGDLQYSDGTARGEGVWVYKNSAWESLANAAPTISSKTANYSLLNSDEYIMANATSGAFTITFPTPVGSSGKTYTIRKSDASLNAVTLSGTGITTYKLLTQNDSATYISDGSNWIQISKIFNPIVASYKASSTTPAATNISFLTLIKDSHSAWNGTQFTAPVDGNYRCLVNIVMGIPAGGAFELQIFKNGSFLLPVSAAQNGPAGGFNCPAHGCATIPLVAGDIISFRWSTGSAMAAMTGPVYGNMDITYIN